MNGFVIRIYLLHKSHKGKKIEELFCSALGKRNPFLLFLFVAFMKMEANPRNLRHCEELFFIRRILGD